MSQPISHPTTVTLPSDLEVVITRTFDAPRQLVFEAWTKPEHLTQWWGIRALNMVECTVDLRVGGAWRYVLSAPDGNNIAFSGTYQEVTPPERLVHTEVFEQMPGTDYVVTVIFEEHAGKTTITSTSRYQSIAHRDGHVQSGMEGGIRETYERLDELIQTLKG